MTKKWIKITGLAFFLPGLFFALVFAKGEEYLRLRTGSAAAERLGIGEVAAPIVEYFIAPEDEMEIFVWLNPDLSKNVIVSPDGQISYPLVGRMFVAGMTVAQLEEKIKEKLSEYIKYPQVSITMRKFAGNKVIVLGEINYPGIYTYKGTLDLIEAVALAGDFTDTAHSNSVIVVRGNLTDKVEVRRINMTRAITRGTKNPEIILQPNDVVFVPKTFVANLNKFMTDIAPIISNANNALIVRKEIRRLQERSR